MKVFSWGRAHPPSEIQLLDSASAPFSREQTTFFGNGRSYGDSCLNTSAGVYGTRQLNKFLAFEEKTGILKCEAGVLLKDIQETFIKRGWSLPVTPGTQLATVGGCIANDVHGKNHHSHGCFGNHIKNIQLSRSDNKHILCSEDENPGLFRATVGGLGLTGLIENAEIQLKTVPSQYLEAENLPFKSLDEFFTLSEESLEWEYTVAWLDGTKIAKKTRGIFSRARHIESVLKDVPDKTISFPFNPHISLVGSWTVRAFNELYYRRGLMGERAKTVHYRSFFYPLDSIHEWNRVYGRRGFFQYQLVVPSVTASRALAEMINTIAKSGEGSFLSVLKVFGDKKSPGMLSFPMPGATLAMDFPFRGKSTLRLFEKLDAVVNEAGGRLYPAKDGRMSSAMFFNGYNNASDFMEFIDPKLSSDFAQRVFGERS